MSKKTRKPNPKIAPVAQDPMPQAAPEIPPLANDADSLVAEWRRLQALIVKINMDIKEYRDTITTADTEAKNLQNQGLQIMGAANELHRILVGMGVDPNKHGLSEGGPVAVPETGPELDFTAEEGYPTEPEEVEADPRLAVLRRRFQS